MKPDPSLDVMVYKTTMIDALEGAPIGERWSVWVGSESEGSFENESEAVSAATQLARDYGRPAWLVDGGVASAICDFR
jgi:hypothetical protein